MSSLWTPGGERPVPRDGHAPERPARQLPEGDEGGAGGDPGGTDAELETRMAELREQLAHTPVEGIVAQMAYQLFEVGALHLSLQPPQFAQAQIAIDALAALVEGLGDGLGEHAAPLRDGLSQIRMAFVQIKSQASQGSAPPPPSDPGDQAPPGS